MPRSHEQASRGIFLLACASLAAMAPLTLAFGIYEGYTRRPLCVPGPRYDWDKSDVRREPEKITSGLDLLERNVFGGGPFVLDLPAKVPPRIMAP